MDSKNDIQLNLDENYRQLDTEGRNHYLLALLKTLVESTQLADEATDCLEVFEDYEWMPNDKADTALFTEYLSLGLEGKLGIARLNEFMGMVSDKGQTHIYFSIYKAKTVLNKNNVS